ncbi:hypothetical protein FP2506_00205 [Fulvimarina pelagi HTCC2506]|uniref:Uncharacterized protein n=1 Tax=Fulvimarina pelagi HTCC2506 TaxID=314231 RepID=Q0FXU4_9HYPH|nr:hypothetical protein [Fulvimarina pelagi]EAU39789.1 hypothetical protein FP2506_00205 [Fulvimarina pelagi HTCC2506]
MVPGIPMAIVTIMAMGILTMSTATAIPMASSIARSGRLNGERFNGLKTILHEGPLFLRQTSVGIGIISVRDHEQHVDVFEAMISVSMRSLMTDH